MKKQENEEAIVAEASAEMERLKVKPGPPSKLWTGLVSHHRDIFVSHVLPKLNKTDRYFFSKASDESANVLKRAGINASKDRWSLTQISSISTLEWAWNNMNWGRKDADGSVVDHAWFCGYVAGTNKLELLKYLREEKKCEWDEFTIVMATYHGNLEILKYCLDNDCPCDVENSCYNAAGNGNLDCVRFLFDKVKPSRETIEQAAEMAAQFGHLDILKYLIEEKDSDNAKWYYVRNSAMHGDLDCLKHMIDEAKKIPREVLDDWQHIAHARYYEHDECSNYLREKGCPEPTDEEYAKFVKHIKQLESSQRLMNNLTGTVVSAPHPQLFLTPATGLTMYPATMYF
jgi:hypothetical protein